MIGMKNKGKQRLICLVLFGFQRIYCILLIGFRSQIMALKPGMQKSLNVEAHIKGHRCKCSQKYETAVIMEAKKYFLRCLLKRNKK